MESLNQARVDIFLSGIHHGLMGGGSLPLESLYQPIIEYFINRRVEIRMDSMESLEVGSLG